MPKRTRSFDNDSDFSNSDSSSPKTKKEISLRIKKPRRTEEWMHGLTDEEIIKIAPEVSKIKKSITDSLVDEKDIAQLDIPFNAKVKLMQQLNIVRSFSPHSYSWYDAKNDLREAYDSWLIDIKDIEMINHLDKQNNYSVGLQEKILRSEVSDKIKAQLYDKFKKIQNYRQSSEEYIKEKKWIETVLNLPLKPKLMFQNLSSEKDKLTKVMETMNRSIYGQQETKERILEFVSVMLSNPKASNKIIALVGPPGVGKTALARSLSSALDLPFAQISLGGMTDSSVLLGHSPTYLSATCGLITKNIIKMGSTNGILFFDEFDKIPNTKKGGKGCDVSDSLLHVLDFEQNKEFHDHYLPEIPIDLSNMFIILSLNNEEEVDPILLDRVNMVYVNGYTPNEKKFILEKYFIPRIIKNLGMVENEVDVTKEAIDFLVNKNESIAGVRQLEMDTFGVFQRINTLKLLGDSELKLSYYMKKFKIPFKLTGKKIEKLYKSSNLKNI
tara:strand:+ start:94723 stop:96216 length:1494 start_codon:yes stop_codon:yes gene_type:complete